MADVNVKTLQTRIALKYDSYANWTDESKEGQGANLVLLKGEIGICEIPSGNANATTAPTVLFKVGDGVNTFKSLKWASALAADVYDWAKAETVVLDGEIIKFKTGDTVKHTIDLSSFATDASVETIRSGLDSRIVALENKFTGDSSVQGQIDALDSRLDIIEGADTVEGSVAKALKDAKAHAESQDAALKTELQGYADQAEADAIAAAETASENKVKVERARIEALEGKVEVINGEAAGSIKKAVADAVTEVKAYADTAESDAVTAAKGYTDTREAAIKTAYEAYADQAEADANSYTDGKVAILNAEDQRLAGLIGGNTTAIGNEATARENADKAIEAKIGTVADGKTVVTLISEAQAAAEATASADAAAKVKSLEDGQVATNAAAITAMDAAYKKAVADEAKAREDADAELDTRLDKVEAFFEGAYTEDGQPVKEALDTLVEIQNFITGEGEAASDLIKSIEANATAIENLEGRMDTAEDDIDALEAKDAELANADTALGQRIDALVGENGTIATGDAATLAAAKSYAEEKASAAESAAKSHADTEVGKLSAKDTEIAGKVTTLQNIVDGYTDKGSIKSAIEAAAAKGQTGIDNAATAQSAAEAAQGTADAVKAAVENTTTGLAATKGIADKAASDLAALTTRVGTAESDIDALEAIVKNGDNTNAKLRSDITALQTLTGDSAKGNEALHTELSRVAGLVDNGTTGLAATKAIADQNKTDIGTLNGKVTAIESDYLKAADVYVFNCGSSTTVTHEQPKA